MKRELRFSIGSYDSLHSTTWKIWTKKNDIYLLSRAMGSELKVSLHESGECQFSRTSDWAVKSGQPNKERHIEKWQMPDRRSPTTAIHAFRIIIPQSELRVASTEESSTTAKSIILYSAPPVGHSAYVEVQISPPLIKKPTKSNPPFDPLDMDVLGILPLSSMCYVIIMAHHLPIEAKDVRQLELLKEQALMMDLLPDPRTRGWAPSARPNGIHALIEFALFPDN